MKNNSIEKTLPALKKEYLLGKLELHKLAHDPFTQFHQWIQAAVRAKVPNPDAMTLSTASKKGVPSSRIVLLKNITKDTFVFFTSYSSPKAKDLEENPRAALTFFWPELERQVRIYGRIKKTSQAESEQYFKTRPKDAQIVSWISSQSKAIESRKELEHRFKVFQEKFRGKDIPLPPHWGGYCLKPDWFEFWQGREHRFNDRFLYRRKQGRWTIEQLQP